VIEWINYHPKPIIAKNLGDLRKVVSVFSNERNFYLLIDNNDAFVNTNGISLSLPDTIRNNYEKM